MMRALKSAALAACLVFSAASTSSAAPSLSGVAPADGTVGTALTISGAELGTSAPKAVLVLHGDPKQKKIPLKVAKPYDGSTVHASVTKCRPGVYDVVVTPKHGSALTLASAFTAHAPTISGLSAAEVSKGDHLVISGMYFGSKKPTVKIGGVSQKVNSWSDGSIDVTVANTQGASSASVDVSGAGGAETGGAQVDVKATGPVDKHYHFTMNFDSGHNQYTSVEYSGSGFSFHSFGHEVSAVGVSTYHIHSERQYLDVTDTIDFQVIGPMTPGQTQNGSMIGAALLESGSSATTWQSDGTASNFFVTITARTSKYVSGRFTGVLALTVGNGAPFLSVSGDFTVVVQ